MAMLKALSPYITHLGASFLLGFSILSDWRQHKLGIRAFVASIFIVWSLLDLATVPEQQAEQAASKEREARFLAEIGELRSQLEIKDLRKDLQKVGASLQKSLAPKPKAELKFSLAHTGFGPLTPVTWIKIKQEPDGTIPVELYIANSTDVFAEDLYLTVEFGKLVKIKEVPNVFGQLNGIDAVAVQSIGGRLPPQTVHLPYRFKVEVPKFVGAFDVGVGYRCATCVVPKRGFVGRVYVVR